jgi:uncharacterized protein (TIGR02145 family)
MATNNNCVGCGCEPSIPEPCVTPPPICPTPEPCTEIINAQCVIYTGPAITCSRNPIIPSNTSVAEALDALVDYLCLGACCSTVAVTQIDYPDYILLCTDSTATCAHVGKLYNWYTLNLGTNGDGRVVGGIVNISAVDNPVNTWRVPNNNDWYALSLALDPLATQVPWVNHAGGKIKSTTCWSLPNSGATNSSGLGVSPTVVRSATTGFFATNNGQNTRYWSGDNNTATTYAVELNYLSDIITAINPGSYKFGYKVRLCRRTECNEADGDFIANAYKDNNGNLYNAEVIGNLVWLNSDLIDIKYNNGTAISNVILDAPWIAATTGAWCYPNNDSTFILTYVNGCQEVKISFKHFLDFIPTSTQTFIVDAAAGIQVNSVVVGSQTTYTVLNTDPGSAQNIFKNIAVATQSTIVADTNNDTLTVVAGAGIDITTNALTDEITIRNTDLGSGVTLADAGLDVAHESLVNDGVGAALAVKGLKAGTGISLSSTATDITITNTSPDIQFTYEIGQYVDSEGGVIMYRWLSATALGTPTSGSIQNYLVVDTQDLSLGTAYATLNVNIPNVESTFDGQVNTSNLIIAGAGSGITVGTAAELCNSSTNNGQTDWYLPSIDELSKLWQNKWDVAQGINLAVGTQLAVADYWSSTENTNVNAWIFSFILGSINFFNKPNPNCVRAVRRFSI